MTAPFIHRITLRNYKSIAACQLDLPRLGFLVGRNGAGKSNFLDSISFVADALLGSLGNAIDEDRDGIDTILRRTGGDLGPMAIRINFTLHDDATGYYGFQVGKKGNDGFEVLREECKVSREGQRHYFVRVADSVESSLPQFPPVMPDRLCLVAAGGFPEFRPVFDLLVRMAVYNPNPEIFNRTMQGVGGVLHRMAKQITGTWKNLDQGSQKRITDFLSDALNTDLSVELRSHGDREQLRFLQKFDGPASALSFHPEAMSDGTLRAMCILAVIMQTSQRDTPLHWLIGLEEPETALHPAMASALLSLLRQASQHNQILVTTHGSDLLDNEDIPPDSIFVVDHAHGVTRIAGMDPASRNAILRGHFTPGELLRQNQLAQDPGDLARVDSEPQSRIFDLQKS